MLNSEDIRADFQNIYILILSLYIVTLISLAANRYFDRRDETNIFIIKITRNKMIPMVILKKTHIPHIVNNIINEK